MITPPIETPKGEQLYNIAMALKGRYLTLDDTVPKTLNCAETISYLLKEAGYNMPPAGYPGTASIEPWLERHFQEIDTPELFCIVNAVTEGPLHGHIAINGHDAMLSNDSQNGTLESYWTLSAFQEFYGKQKGLAIKYFRVV